MEGASEYVVVVGPYGRLRVDAEGKILGRRPAAYALIEKLDLDEFTQWSSSHGWSLCFEEQLGTMGYWLKTGVYKAADEKARQKIIDANVEF